MDDSTTPPRFTVVTCVADCRCGEDYVPRYDEFEGHHCYVVPGTLEECDLDLLSLAWGDLVDRRADVATRHELLIGAGAVAIDPIDVPTYWFIHHQTCYSEARRNFADDSAPGFTLEQVGDVWYTSEYACSDVPQAVAAANRIGNHERNRAAATLTNLAATLPDERLAEIAGRELPSFDLSHREWLARTELIATELRERLALELALDDETVFVSRLRAASSVRRPLAEIANARTLEVLAMSGLRAVSDHAAATLLATIPESAPAALSTGPVTGPTANASR